MAPDFHQPLGERVSCRLHDMRISRRGLIRGAAALAALSAIGLGTTVSADDGEYVVQPGNTLYMIARKFGMSVAELVTLNGIDDPDFLSIGQRLRVHVAPPAATVATPAPASSSAPAPAPAPAPPELNREVTSRGASPTGASVVEIARSCLGMPYAWAGTSPRVGFDCSGFAYYVYNRAGIAMGRHLSQQLASGPRVALEKLLPGDLVFFANTYEAGLSHVGIFIGDNQFIHSEDETYGVRVSSLTGGYWGAHYYAACRPGAR